MGGQNCAQRTFNNRITKISPNATYIYLVSISDLQFLQKMLKGLEQIERKCMTSWRSIKKDKVTGHLYV